MKICAECKVVQELDCFAGNKAKPDGKSDKCKTCKKAYNVEYYKRTKHIHNPDRFVRRDQMRQEALAFVRDFKKGKSCIDCDKVFHPFCMDFDHVRGKKRKDISRLANEGASLIALAEEIAKCELVCALCHRLRTAYRLGMLTFEETNMRQ